MAAFRVAGSMDDSALRLPLPRLAESSFSAGDGACVPALTDEGLFERCGTRIAFTGRRGGVSAAPYASLNLSYAVGDDCDAVRANRRVLLECLGAPASRREPVSPRQVHGTDIVRVTDAASSRDLARLDADGVVCTLSGVPVLLCFADCVPLVLVAPGGAFAVAHAGWRGAIAGIAAKALASLAEASGCAPCACNCYIGPHIGSCCYDVSEELLGRFTDVFGPACSRDGRLDLSAAVVESLVRAGADAGRIADARVCTSCEVGAYYSYRAEAARCGRHGAYVCKGWMT